ncbi:MAG: hypothetical protein ACP6IS_02135 [Candidatus Asgardarchaeia archaeon]
MDGALPLMSTNAGSKQLKRNGSWLLVGSCVLSEHKEILEKLVQSYDTLLHVCLEETHINMAEAKLAAMVKLSKPALITVLTVDGSPHCIQLHYLAEDLKKYYNLDLEIKHLVIYKREPIEINTDAVKISRYLSKIQKLIK